MSATTLPLHNDSSTEHQSAPQPEATMASPDQSAPTEKRAATKLPPTGPTTLSLGKAINLGLRQALAEDDKVMLMGEDIGKLGGVFRVTDGLQAEFGEQRVVDAPLAESGIVGTAIGLAMRGYRPVLEIQFDGFIFPAFDQITTQLAKYHYRTQGRQNLPIVIRVPYGGGIGAIEHHSESPEALFAHTPGLRVVTCSNPADAYTMIREAIASPDPVLFFEPKGRYWDKATVDLVAPPAPRSTPDNAADGDAKDQHTDDALSPEVLADREKIARGESLNTAVVARQGTDITLVAYGPTVHTALKVAETAQNEGTSIEVIDLRAISPIDFATITASVNKTGRCIVAHEAPTFLGAGAEIAARVSEACFYALESPVLRVGGFHIPYPVSKVEHDYLPGLDRILDAVDRALAF